MSSKKTILIVDDDPTFVETTKIALEKDYDIQTANNGKECLEKVDKDKPDLIILDVMMRHLGEGIDVANKLKSEDSTRNIPIIMLTGVSKVYDMSTQVDKSQYQSDAWIEKPIEPEKLLEEVKKLLADS